MWIPFGKGRSWNCEQCLSNPSLREKRGNCGSSFKKGLPQSLQDEEGIYVPGYRIAPNSGESYSDLKIRSCPISDMNRLASIISNYNRIKKGILQFSEVYPNPSIAIIESIETLDYNYDEMIHRQHEQALKDS